MSFLIDPPLLVAAGAAVERLAPNERNALRWEAGTLAVFLGVSTAVYLNAPGTKLVWSPFGSRSGRDFMVNSGLLHLDTPRGVAGHAAAAAAFATYPAWLRLGRHLARRRS